MGASVRDTLERIRARQMEPRDLSPDVYETPEAYVVVFDAPGVDHADVQVRYVNGEVMARVERFRDDHDGFELIESERAVSMDGQIALPDDAIVSPEVSEATLRSDGTLQIRLPKTDDRAEPEQPATVSQEH